jgi:hypothetical protein
MIASERITHAYLLPTMFTRLLRLAPEARGFLKRNPKDKVVGPY